VIDFREVLRRAQEVKERLARLEEELAQRRVSASAGGGMVTVVVNGRQEVLEVRIEPQVVDPGDLDLLQDLVRGAVNEALARARRLAAEEAARVTGGLDLPGLS